MARKSVLAGLIAATAVLAAGCTACPQQVADLALPPDECLDPDAMQRNRVHIFLVNGADILDVGGLSTLREKLTAAGYSQSYYGYPYNCFWFGREMRRIAGEDKLARFVIIGYELGAGSAVDLAADARRHGVSVDAVVLLDPAAVGTETRAAVEAPIHVIQSDGWAMRDALAGSETVVLSRVGHFSVPTAPPTVEHITRLLREAAAHVPDDSDGRLVLPLIDEPPPLPTVIPGPSAPPVDGNGLVKQGLASAKPTTSLPRPNPPTLSPAKP
jgi:pimeloyl-ACP methyl ester carboxylesterase